MLFRSIIIIYLNYKIRFALQWVILCAKMTYFSLTEPKADQGTALYRRAQGGDVRSQLDLFI